MSLKHNAMAVINGNVVGTYFGDEKLNTSAVASYETGTTSSKAYSIGDYLYKNGILYKVIAAISQGDNLVVNTNIQATTLLDEISAYSPVTVDSSLSSSSENPVQNKVIDAALSDKVDKVTGKGLSSNDYTNADKSIVSGVTSALTNKVDKVNGKGLSTNDYTTADKAIVDGVTTALAGKVDAVSGKGLSTNDYTAADKAIVDNMSTALAGKVDVVTGKGLSTNDYTDADKAKIDGLGTAASKDVAASGDASSTEVVMGNDSRLTDSRNAADVYDWAKASTKPSYTASEVGAIDSTLKGAASGVAELDANGKVPTSQLPSYVDDVIEGYLYNDDFYAEDTHTTSITGETGKIYVDLATNTTYRWSGTAFVAIPEGIALGETSSTAYAGNKGKANADNIAAIQELIPSSATTSNLLATASDIPDVTDKADLVASATSGDLASLDSNGNLADSGIAANNVVVKSETEGLLKNDGTVDTKRHVYKDVYWESKTWGGITSLDGNQVWSDGENIYYSYNGYQYIYDKSTSTWSNKTWTGLTSFNGQNVWVDGDNVYYSYSSVQYELNKTTSTWSAKTWTGLTSFNGNRVWTDGENIYYSNSSSQYVLNRSNDTWSAKTWSGLSSFSGEYIWTDGNKIYLSSTSGRYELNKATSTWSSKTWTGLTTFTGNYVWTDGENIYYSYGSLHYKLNKSTSTWSEVTWTGLNTFNGDRIWSDGENTYFSSDTAQYQLIDDLSKYITKVDIANKADKVASATSGDLAGLDSNGNLTDSGIVANNVVQKSSTNGLLKNDGTIDTSKHISLQPTGSALSGSLSIMTWNGFSYPNGSNIWTDGENIYFYDYVEMEHYVLNKATNTWSTKTWNETISNIACIWKDGDKVYYSEGTTHYELNKTAGTWSTKTWNGLSSFYGQFIWTDGDNIYYSYSSKYVLDKSTSTWSTKTWSGLTSFRGDNIWTDGDNIYYSDDSKQYILDKSTSTWSTKTWTGLTYFYGSLVWTDGDNIYYSYDTDQYVLNKATSTWSAKTWSGLSNFNSENIWTDGDNIYYSDSTSQYVFDTVPAYGDGFVRSDGTITEVNSLTSAQLAALLAILDTTTSSEPEEPVPTTLTATPSSIFVTSASVGDTWQITTVVEDQNGDAISSPDLVYSPGNYSDYITISSTGLITLTQTIPSNLGGSLIVVSVNGLPSVYDTITVFA